MDFQELISKRYSVRAYKSDPVEEGKLQKVLDAARLAPTAANRQPIQFVVIHTAGREEDLKLMYKKDWLSQAPLVVVACAVYDGAWVRMDNKNYCEVDATIAMDHLILAATDLGLGTCWIAAFDPQAVRKLLKLPEGVEPIALTPIGYPADQPKEKKRKPLSELVRYDHW
ncbi:MAG: nitroreductase [Syntrophobacteraceae bacterium CG23_combo_of_CG06-09_8_20_14_all_50_8]|nr:MAG: nitroreductase [Syntrophobacteraceae bacterium CG23_combo_of_CG06-09_8_20_14_all_50_8]